MSGKKKQIGNKIPLKKGYQPIQDNLDTSKPPKGGSGVPSKSSSDTKKANKKD
jgi:hypothetical protein